MEALGFKLRQEAVLQTLTTDVLKSSEIEGEETRNRFRLRRISEHADYELRIDPWRVFYRVETQTVTVELIGQKKGNVLLIGGKEFKL
jgi:hypothetical protein